MGEIDGPVANHPILTIDSAPVSPGIGADPANDATRGPFALRPIGSGTSRPEFLRRVALRPGATTSTTKRIVRSRPCCDQERYRDRAGREP